MIAKILRTRFFLPALLVVALGAIIGFYIAMAADGEVVSIQKISDTEGNFSAVLDDMDYFGFAVANVGDINNDGVTDLAVGAYGDDDSGLGAGAIYILFMDVDGTLDASAGESGAGWTKISATSGGGVGALDAGDSFGTAVAGIGDLNGDDVEDIVVGSADDIGSQGSVYILFLDTDGTMDDVTEYQKISDGIGGMPGSVLEAFDGFGSSVANIGDLNGDDVTDIAVGAPGDGDGGSSRGATYVLFLDTDGTLDATAGVSGSGYTKVSDTAGDFSAVLDDGDTFGSALAGIGDLNGDGVEDLVSTARGDGDGGSYRGAVYVLFLDPDGSLDATAGVSGAGWTKISDTEGSFTATISDNDTFGSSVGVLGDLNSDGVTDLVVGMQGDDGGTDDKGSVFIVFLDTDGSVDASAGSSGAGWTKIADSVGGFTSLDDEDKFGSSAAGIGDLNADGVPDAFVGAIWGDDGGDARGETYILFLDGADATAPTAGGGGAITATPDFFTMDLSWTAATDNVTAAGSLVYKVYRAAAGADLDSVADIEANGTLVSTQTSGDVTYTLVDLQPNTVYTYNVIVSDEAGNKTAYTQGSTETLYPSQVTPVFIENAYFNIRGDECTWDRNIILEVGGRNIQSVVVADNPQFLNAEWQPFRANTTIRAMGGPTPIMEIRRQLPREYGKYTYYALVKSVTGNQSRTMIDSITLTSRRNCEYPSRQRVPYFGKSDADILAYQDAIDKAMDVEEEIAYEKKLQDEANEASLVYVEGVKEGDLVKTADNSALYYVAKVNEPTDTTTGLTRHAFPNEQIFQTWYSKDDMKRAQVVSERTMDRIPLKAPMPPKPNSTLVKFENDKTIYLPAININAKPNTTPYNIILRPITTDGLTEELFGREYKTMILTLPESLKSQMTLGNAITKFEASIAKLKNTLRRW